MSPAHVSAATATARNQRNNAVEMETMRFSPKSKKEEEDLTTKGCYEKYTHAILNWFKQGEPMLKAYLSSAPASEPASCAHLQWRMAVAMHSPTFNMLLGVMLLLNSALIGVELDTDVLGQLPGQMFIVLFSIEICCRIFCLGTLFFMSGPNLFDFVVVGMALLAEIITRTASGMSQGGSLVTIFRLIRLFRMARLFTTFKDLKLILESFMKAILGIFWVLVMLILYIYIFAVFAREFIGNSQGLMETVLSSGVTGDQLFGAMGKSFITMTQMLTLDSWTSQVSRPIAEEHAWTYGFFLFYTLSGAFGIMNLLTAVFVNALLEASEQRKTKFIKNRRAEKLQSLTQIQEIFSEVDSDGSGQISIHEMDDAMTVLRHPQWHPLFEALEMTPTEFGKFLQYFTAQAQGSDAVGGDDEVSYAEFIEHFSSMDEQLLKGGAWKQQAEVHEIKMDMEELTEEMQQGFAVLAEIIATLCKGAGLSIAIPKSLLPPSPPIRKHPKPAPGFARSVPGVHMLPRGGGPEIDRNKDASESSDSNPLFSGLIAESQPLSAHHMSEDSMRTILSLDNCSLAPEDGEVIKADDCRLLLV